MNNLSQSTNNVDDSRPPVEARMKVDTTRFGTLEIDDSSVIRMPKGPLGFEENRDYCLIQHCPDSSFRWLQSVDEPGLAFVVVDPSQFFAGYEFEAPDAEAETLGLTSADDAMILVMITISEEGREITANLAAPILVNSRSLMGTQVILQDNRYMVKHAIVVNTDRGASKDAQRHRARVKAALPTHE
jgi:flagellar assembly factor FliW